MKMTRTRARLCLKWAGIMCKINPRRGLKAKEYDALGYLFACGLIDGIRRGGGGRHE